MGIAEGIVNSEGKGGQSALLFDAEEGDRTGIIEDFVISPNS
jgi:hypothetical protein